MTARPTISGSSAPQLLPDPLSEAHGDLSLTEAASFLRILEGVLAKEAAPLGPAALLAVLCFLKRVAALGAWEPEPTTGPWEQLGQAVMSVASLALSMGEWSSGEGQQGSGGQAYSAHAQHRTYELKRTEQSTKDNKKLVLFSCVL